MTAGGGVGVLADLRQARAALSQNATYPADVALARNAIDRSFVAIAELIAADREYDEARALVDEGDACPWPEDFERLEAATARRASALAALGQQP